ncbi:MAG: hypothetical protein EBT57_09495 [Verrucomicrobia bacterium]|nr:hypothetical protein [Verrucomicrobiota bacterium]
MVTIPAGSNSASFYLDAVRDRAYDTNKSVAVTATPGDSNFDGDTGTVVVNNIDANPDGFDGVNTYSASFASLATNAALPLGWTVESTGGSAYTNITSYWGNAGAGAGVVVTNGILGYQHTGNTLTSRLILTLKNTSGGSITNLTLGYKGRASRLTEGRTPAFTVTIDGQTNEALAYTTAYGDGVSYLVGVTNLSIPNNAQFTIVWSSDRGGGSGSSQQIGLSDVTVQNGFTPTAPALTGLAADPNYVFDTTAEVLARVTYDGGSAVTSSGFVYCLTSQTNAPSLGGTGVVDSPWVAPGTGIASLRFCRPRPIR